MVTEIPTAAPALRPAVADCGSVLHPGSIGKIAVTTYMCHLQKWFLPWGVAINRAVNTSLK